MVTLDEGVVLLCFAFVREPQSPDSTQWSSPVGSQQRRSLEIQRIRTFRLFRNSELPEDLDFAGVMEGIKNHSPELEGLRVSYAGMVESI